MSLSDYEKKEFMERWPWIPSYCLIDVIVKKINDNKEYSDFDLQLDHQFYVVRELIINEEKELLHAKNIDDVELIKTRLKILQEHEFRLTKICNEIIVDNLRIRYFVGYGFHDDSGIRKIIKSNEWPLATIEWDDGIVTTGTGRYVDVFFLNYEELSHEIQYIINRDLREAGEFVPYIPGEEEYHELMAEDSNDASDLNVYTNTEDVQLPKNKEQNKQATNARDERWRARGREIYSANPKATIIDIARLSRPGRLYTDFTNKSGLFSCQFFNA